MKGNEFVEIETVRQEVIELLQQNKGDEVIELLQSNLSMNMLDLSRIGIGQTALKTLAQIVARNTTLRLLDLSSNAIDDEGLQILGEGLRENQSLRCVLFEHNNISIVGVKLLEQAIVLNNTIEFVNLTNNSYYFGPELLKDIRLYSFGRMDGDTCGHKESKREASTYDLSKKEKEEDSADEAAKWKCDIFAIDITYNNYLLNKPNLLTAFRERYGIQKLNYLITLTDELAKEDKTFNQNLKEALEGTHSTDEALCKLEALMGLTSDNSDLV